MDNNKLTGPETQTWCLVVNSSIHRCEFASGWIRNFSWIWFYLFRIRIQANNLTYNKQNGTS